MERFDRGLEFSNSKSSEERQTFDINENKEKEQQLNKDKQETKEQQKQDLKDKMNELKRLEVQEFIREKFKKEECVEPIGWVNTIIPYKELLESLIKSAEDEFDRIKSSGAWVESEEYKNAFEIKNKLELFKKSKKEKLSDEEKKQIMNIAKDERLYKLPVYRQLIEKWWFILPSDVRDYYDSAEQTSVYHLWIDYNVKVGTEVKAMYDWEVVWSWYTWEPWKSSLWHKVVIRHKMPDWTEFYSLYGHLWKSGLISKWSPVKKWDIVWKVWEALTDENWNWQAHLHFQIIENEESPEWYSKIEWEWNYDVLKSFGKQ